MPLIRAEITQGAYRAREVILGGLTGLGGLWTALQGGFLLIPFGAAVAGLGLVWMVTAWRRMRFAQAVAAPGIVEIDEGQIGYFGPEAGGYVAIPDLSELRLIEMRGRRLWQLRQADGQALLIPVDATGADRLFDAFASLPGMDTAALVAALDGSPQQGSGGLGLSSISKTLWRRAGPNAVQLRDGP
jgi:hypothetical protein